MENTENKSPQITPFLWLDNQAEKAMNFYLDIFIDSEILSISRNGEAGPGPKGSVMVVRFRLGSQILNLINGGPHFKLTEAFSLVVDCESQAEVDYYWEALSAGGVESQCGWLKDKFGLSWQIVPKRLIQLLSDPDQAKSGKVMQAMMKMKKIDIPTLEASARA